MPRRKSHIGRVTSSAKRMRHNRSLEDYDQRQNRLLKSRMRHKASRQKEAVISSLNDCDNQPLNGNIIAANIAEVPMQESQPQEDLDEQSKGESSKQTKGDVDEKRQVINVSELDSAIRLEDTSKGVCCFKAEVKIETIE